MLILSELPDKLSNPLLLNDGTWQHATVGELTTTSEFFNRASLVILSKRHAAEAAAALLYLLQKEAKFLLLWEDAWDDSTPTVAEFIKQLSLWGRFTNDKGQVVSVEEFWKSYTETMNAIQAESSFEYCEEGKGKPFTEPLAKEEIQQVICFDQEWNEQNYLIETETEWVLFSWNTMA